MEEKPTGVIGPGDLNMLRHILSFYELWIINNIAFSAKRVELLSQVKVVLTTVSMLSKTKVVILTYDDVACIDDAIKTFIKQVEEKIPQMQEREGVLESCEGLRLFIVTTFGLKQT